TATDITPSNDTATRTVTITPSADVKIAKSLATTLVAGSPVTYTIAVNNVGPSPAQNVVVTDTIVPALTLTSVTSTGSCITFPCTIATLAAGATETISATFSVPSNASGSVTNNANANSSTTPDPTSLNNSASVTTPISQQGVLTVI